MSDDRSADIDVGETTRTTAVTTTVPSTTTTDRSVVGTVTHTCGATGRGDCFLSVRTAPTSDSEEVARLNEGSSVRIVCQVLGQTVKSSAGGTSNVWARTEPGHYVANVYVQGDGIDRFNARLRCP